MEKQNLKQDNSQKESLKKKIKEKKTLSEEQRFQLWKETIFLQNIDYVIFCTILGSFSSGMLVKSDFKYWFISGGILLSLIFLNRYLCRWKFLIGMKIIKLNILICLFYFYIIGDIYIEEPFMKDEFLAQDDQKQSLDFFFYRGFIVGYFLQVAVTYSFNWKLNAIINLSTNLIILVDTKQYMQLNNVIQSIAVSALIILMNFKLNYRENFQEKEKKRKKMKIYKNLLKREFPNGLILLEQKNVSLKGNGQQKDNFLKSKQFSLKTLMVNKKFREIFNFQTKSEEKKMNQEENQEKLCSQQLENILKTITLGTDPFKKQKEIESSQEENQQSLYDSINNFFFQKQYQQEGIQQPVSQEKGQNLVYSHYLDCKYLRKINQNNDLKDVELISQQAEQKQNYQGVQKYVDFKDVNQVNENFKEEFQEKIVQLKNKENKENKEGESVNKGIKQIFQDKQIFWNGYNQVLGLQNEIDKQREDFQQSSEQKEYLKEGAKKNEVYKEILEEKEVDQIINLDIKLIDLCVDELEKNSHVLIIFDEGENRLKEFRSQKLIQFKGKLMNSLQHNLKTPLNSIMGLATAGLNEQNEIKVKDECLTDILKSGTIFLSMIKMIQYQNQENLEIQPCQFSLSKTLKNLEWVFTKQFQVKGMSMSVENKVSDQEIILQNDPDLIEFVLMQLIENSIKYSKQNTHVKIKTFEVAENDSLIGFEVLDQGQGMSQLKIQFLFQSLETKFLNSKDSKHYKEGLGLGFNICNKIIKKMGPRQQNFLVQSQQQKGTSIQFFIYKDVSKFQEIQNNQFLEKIQKNHQNSIISNQNYLTPPNQSLEKNQEIKVNQQEIIDSNFQENLENQKQNFPELQNKLNLPDYQENQKSNQIKFSQNPEKSQITSPKFFQSITSISDEEGISVKISRYNQTKEQSTFLKKTNQPNKNLLNTNQNTQDIQMFQNIIKQATRILAVDDMPYNINCIEMILKKIPLIQIVPAFTGDEALEIIEKDQNNPSIKDQIKIKFIIMDINMPGMDGIQATKIIKNKYKDSIKVFILSAFDDNIDRKRAQEAGADCFLNKPLTISKLYNCFLKMLD